MSTNSLTEAPPAKRDPLLSSARALVSIIRVLIAFAIIIVSIAIGAVLTVKRPEILAKIAAAGAPPSTYVAVVVALALVVASLVIGQRFLTRLREIIDSVRDGDPFAPANADRLQAMGWLWTSIIGILLVVSLLTGVYGQYAEALGAHRRNDGPGLLSSVLLALILFILAKVFRAGTEMRAELEGTV